MLCWKSFLSHASPEALSILAIDPGETNCARFMLDPIIEAAVRLEQAEQNHV